MENLASRPWREPGEVGAVPSESSTKDAQVYVPAALPATGQQGPWGECVPATLEAAKETKESKKQENKKPALLFLVPGKEGHGQGQRA